MTDDVVLHETRLNKFKSIEIMQTIFPDHNEFKLEINNVITRKTTNIQKWNDTLVNNSWIKDDTTREFRNYLKQNKKEHSTSDFWDVAKTELRVTFIAKDASAGKKKGLKFNDVRFYLEK